MQTIFFQSRSAVAFASSTRCRILYSFLVCLTFLLSGCDANREPAVSDSTEPRIVSLAPNYTEILFALDAQQFLTGRTDFCDYPAEARTIPSVGSLGTPNWERMIAVRPNLVFTTIFQDDRDQKRLQDRNIRVFCRDITSISGLYERISETASLVNREEAGRALIQNLQTASRPFKPLVPASSPTRVLILVGHRPLCTIGKETFQADLVRFLGAENVSDSLSQPYVNISPEQVIQWRPDVIFYPAMDGRTSPETLYSWPGWESVPAIKNRRVYCDLSADVLFRPGPRFVQALQELNLRLHFPDSAAEAR